MSSSVSNPMHKNCFNAIRPGVMSPRSLSPATYQESETESESVSCEKRNFSKAFNDENEEHRYGQKISETFFESNIGHCVVVVNEKVQEDDVKKRADEFQNATDNVIHDFNMDFSDKFKYKKPEEIDVQEIIEWCEFYRKNRNLFNV